MMQSSEQRRAVGLSDAMRVAVLENLSDGVYFVDLDRRILYWNQAAEQITGYAEEEVVGRRCRDGVLNHCDGDGTILCGELCPLLGTMADGEQREAHVYLHHKDGHRKPVRVRAAPIRDANGSIVGAAEVFHEDSELIAARHRAAYLESASMSDSLTGVGSRRLGEALLAGLLEQHRQVKRPFGVLLVDIDMLHIVNEQFSHDAGDEAVRLVARTLTDIGLPDHSVIRWRGEEFLVIAADATVETLRPLAELLRVMVSRTQLVIEGETIPLSVSMGGTLAAPGDTAEAIVRRADLLLHGGEPAAASRIVLDRNL